MRRSRRSKVISGGLLVASFLGGSASVFAADETGECPGERGVRQFEPLRESTTQPPVEAFKVEAGGCG